MNMSRRALATATTHDMPTLRSYWEGRDIELRRRLNLYPSTEVESDIIRERDARSGVAVGRPARAGTQTRSIRRRRQDPFTHGARACAASVSGALGRRLVALQIEDLLGDDSAGQCAGHASRIPELAAQAGASTSRSCRNAQDIAAHLDEIQPRARR